MSTLEDRVRAATQARAEEITPAGIPPLRLSPAASRSGRQSSRPLIFRCVSTPPAEFGISRPPGVAMHPRRWLRLLVPLAAAAAVAAIAAGLTVLARDPGAHPGQDPAAPPGQLGPAARWVSRAIPHYYLALVDTRKPRQGNPADAAIYSSVSGARLASVVPPKPFATFVNVSAAADDRTFVLAAKLGGDFSGGPGVGFFVLRFSPRDNSTRLTPVTGLAEFTNERIDTFALSPDGRKLALAVELTGSASGISEVLQILSISSGAETDWSTADGMIAADTADPLAMSWTADGKTLAFNWLGSGRAGTSHPTARQQAESGLRLLDLSSPSRDLIAASRLALPVRGQNRTTAAGSESDIAVITPDGRTILAAVNGPVHLPVKPSGRYDTGFAEFSAATGDVQRVRDWRPTSSPEHGGPTDVLWTSRSGKILVVYSPAGHWNRIGVLRGNRLTLLPQSPLAQVPAAAW